MSLCYSPLTHRIKSRLLDLALRDPPHFPNNLGRLLQLGTNSAVCDRKPKITMM